jgi:hypothetical protein
MMVDDIDSGLHYSSMVKVWTSIAVAARSYNVQVVATTHSWECLRAAHESFSGGEQYDFRLHRLDRRESFVEAVTYDRKMVEVALESGMELR